jgi:pimeloyl-ACP methyl ester carboxylesterase
VTGTPVSTRKSYAGLCGWRSRSRLPRRASAITWRPTCPRQDRRTCSSRKAAGGTHGTFILVGHSAGAADIGIAALQGPKVVKGVVFLDGDATPLAIPSFLGAIAGTLFINPYKTSVLRLVLSQDWLIKDIYNSQCGPACPQLTEAGVNTWRWPLEQPGFQAEITYSMRYGITAMTPAQFAALKATDVPKLVVVGAGDPQMPPSDAVLTAQRIGAPAPVYVPGRHLTMIASPRQVAAAIDSLDNQ